MHGYACMYCTSAPSLVTRSQTISMVCALQKEGLVNIMFDNRGNFGGNNLIGSFANYLVCTGLPDHKCACACTEGLGTRLAPSALCLHRASLSSL